MPVIAAALPVAAWTTFDYWAPDGFGAIRGSVVRVPLGRRKVTAVITATDVASELARDKLQPVDARIEGLPALPEDVRPKALGKGNHTFRPCSRVCGAVWRGMNVF